MTAEDPGLSDRRSGRSRFVPGVLAAVVVAVIAGTLALVAVMVRGGGGDGAGAHPAMARPAPSMVAPAGVLDLATVAPNVALEYRYAAAHPDRYRQLRCWCGCENAYGHRSLEDCFVRAGGGWEAHGAGCAVCIGEATTARQRLDAGAGPGEIAKELDATYGPLPAGT